MNKSAKNGFAKFVGSRWAIRKEDAEVLASSGLKWLKDDEGYWSAFKKDGEVSHENNVTMRDDGIAVLHIDGSLSYRSDLWSAWFGLDTYNSIEAALDELIADESVAGIVLDINSPGGEVSGVGELAAKIFKARDKKRCGIVAHTGGLMCSAAYWIGSACSKVYTADVGTLGSIGVLCSFTKFSDDSGIKVETIVSDLSPNKAPTPDNAEGLALIKKELNDLASVFISAVAKHRGVDFETVMKDFGQGGVFIGENAVKAGLADGVKSIDEICEEMLNNQNGGYMPGTKNAGENTAPTAEEIAREAVAAERSRVKAIGELFAGMAIDQKEVQALIDDGKTVAEAKDVAFAKAKETIAAQAKEIENLKKSANAENAEQADAMKKMLEKQNEASAQIQGGSTLDAEAAKDAAILAAFKAGSEKVGK